MRHIHQYLYGRNFVLVTDHKLLLSVFGPKYAIPPLAAVHLQRWAVFLSAYSYEVEFQTTDRHANARLPLQNQGSNETLGEVNVFSLSQIEYLPVTALEIKRDSKNDPILNKIFRYTKIGWLERV